MTDEASDAPEPPSAAPDYARVDTAGTTFLVALAAAVEDLRARTPSEDDLDAAIAAVRTLRRDASWTPARRRLRAMLERIYAAGDDSTKEAIRVAVAGLLPDPPKVRADAKTIARIVWVLFLFGAVIVTVLAVRRNVFSQDLEESMVAFGSFVSGVTAVFAFLGLGAVVDDDVKELLRAVLRSPAFAIVGASASIVYFTVMLGSLSDRTRLVVRCAPDAAWARTAEVIVGDRRSTACGYDDWIGSRQRIRIFAPDFVATEGTADELRHDFVNELLDLAPEPFVSIATDRFVTEDFGEDAAAIADYCDFEGDGFVPLAAAQWTVTLRRKVPDGAALEIALAASVREATSIHFNLDLEHPRDGCQPQGIDGGARVPLTADCIALGRPIELRYWACRQGGAQITAASFEARVRSADRVLAPVVIGGTS